MCRSWNTSSSAFDTFSITPANWPTVFVPHLTKAHAGSACAEPIDYRNRRRKPSVIVHAVVQYSATHWSTHDSLFFNPDCIHPGLRHKPTGIHGGFRPERKTGARTS